MRTRLPAVLWLTVLIAVGLLFSPVIGLAQDGHGHHESADNDGQVPATSASCGMHQTHETCMATMAKLEALLAEAAEAIEGNEIDAAAEKIAEAQALLELSHESMAEAMPDHQASTTSEDGIVNTRCPIMPKTLDPDNVPEDLTREHEGQTIGFCCPACLTAWDKLSDDQKEAKLTAAAEHSETEADNHGAHHSSE